MFKFKGILLITACFFSSSSFSQNINHLSVSFKLSLSQTNSLDIFSINNNGEILGSYLSETKTNYKTVFIAYPSNKGHDYRIETVGSYFLPKVFQLTDGGKILCLLPARNLNIYEPFQITKEKSGIWTTKPINTKMVDVTFGRSNDDFIVLNSSNTNVPDSRIINRDDFKIIHSGTDTCTIVSVNSKGNAAGFCKFGDTTFPIVYIYKQDTIIPFLSKINGHAVAIDENDLVCGVFYTSEMEERTFTWNVSNLKTFFTDAPLFTDLDPDKQTTPIFINNEMIVARSGASFVYFKNGNKYYLGNVLENYGIKNAGVKNIISINERNELIIKLKDNKFILIKLP